jgi:hypothetical protein
MDKSAEQECLLLSIILNLAIDGDCILDEVHPSIANFVRGLVDEYDEDDVDGDVLYDYAVNTLTPLDKRTMH